MINHNFDEFTPYFCADINDVIIFLHLYDYKSTQPSPSAAWSGAVIWPTLFSPVLLASLVLKDVILQNF